jgi:hypothetical protein
VGRLSLTLLSLLFSILHSGYLYGLGSAVGSTAAQPNSIATFNSAAGSDSPLITNVSTTPNGKLNSFQKINL